MSIASRIVYALRALLRRGRADAELEEELAFHLEREAAMLEQNGMSRTEARREAARRFGGTLRYREESQDVWRIAWLDDLRTDARFALRLFRRHPGFSLHVVAIAALGIAACATTASLVSGILLSPLPFAGAARVVSLQLRPDRGESSAAIPPALYYALARNPSVAAIAAFSPNGGAVDWSGEPERIRVDEVTASFFRVFRLALPLGRAFTDEEEREGAQVALLGYELWRTRFNGDSSVLGRALRYDDRTFTIIGVTPPRFRGHRSTEPALWLPMSVTATGPSNGRGVVNAVVRVADSLTVARAEERLSGFSARMEPATGGDSVLAKPMLEPITNLIFGVVRKPLLVLFGAVVLVVLLVAANVGTMLLARTSARTSELGMRLALGASRGRQRRQLVTEAMVLTGIGGAIGVGASYWLIDAVRGLGLRVLPRMDDVALDWRVVAFAVAATVLTGVVGGLAPALASASGTATPGDGASRVTSQRTSTALVVAQVALSVVLLAGGGLLMKSFLRILPNAPGFAVENRAVLVMGLRGGSSFSDTTPAGTRGFVADVTGRLRAVPGVHDAAAMSFAPFFGSVSILDPVEVAGIPQPERPFTAYSNMVTPNFFDVMQIPIVHGRGFTASDRDGAPLAAVVNQTAAARWWPGENPIGRTMTTPLRQGRVSLTVVGVSRDARLRGTDTRIRPEVYLAVAQHDPRNVTFIVHTDGEPRRLMRQLQRAVWSVAPRLPISTATDLSALASDSVRRQRFFSVAITLFAVASIALTALGIHGLLAFGVMQQRREIGIRIAIGAPARSVAGLVMRRAVAMGASGIALGAVLAVWLSRYLETLLIEVSARDGQVFVAACAGVLAVALLAASAPVVQAVRVDPIDSLRR